MVSTGNIQDIRPETAQHGVISASVTFRMVNGIVALVTTNRRARRSKRSSEPSFPSMERGLAGATMTGCDPDSIEQSR